MQVKKFEAPTLQEALDTVKRELGPEAIILQTKKYKRGFGLMSKASVEVTAAISERSMQKKAYVETRMPESSREAMKRLPAGRQADMHDKYVENNPRAEKLGASGLAAKKITATRYIDIDPLPVAQVRAPVPHYVQSPAPRLAATDSSAGPAMPTDVTTKEELRHLKRMIEEIKSAQDEGLTSGAQALINQSKINTPALHDAFEQMIINGVDKRYAFHLVKSAAFELGEEKCASPESVLDQVASEIMQSTEVSSPLSGILPEAGGGPVVLALVGPTGVGKTTTVAKMASEGLLKRNLKVGLINLDSYKVAAFDQLGTYAKILNVPFRSAASVEDLKAAIQDFHSLDLVIVDTTGRSQRDPGSLNDMQKMLSSIEGIRTHLVLSVTTRDIELYDMSNRFAIFKPQGLIISKLDEGSIYGAVYNISQRAKLPLLYFTTGQRVPEDIEEATRERVASLILDL